MSVRFDDETMELALGVRDLAFTGGGWGGSDREGSLPLSRLALGRVASDIHRERARIASRQGSTEVTVRFETRCRGYRVTISGRIDALLDGDEGIVVEEVKTIFRRSENLPRTLESAGLEDYRKQVLLYGFLIEEARRSTVRCRLLLVSAIDRGSVEIAVPYRRGEVEAFLAGRLERLVAEHLEERVAQDRRRAWGRSLPFPFPACRPHQEELMCAVEEALEARRPLLLSAPAGIGKTVGALYPSLRHALDRGHRLVFLTAKNTQAEMVRETLERMGIRGSPVRALFLRSKEKMCAAGHLVCHEDVCEYLRDFSFRFLGGGWTDVLLDDGIVLPDRVYARAAAAGLCPFYASMSLVRRADILVGDYNYVFDPIVALDALFEDRAAENTILVVDEVHNLPRRVMDAYSPALTRRVLDEARREVRFSLEPARVAMGDFLARIDAYLASLRDALDPGIDPCLLEPDVERFLSFREELEALVLRFLLSEERPPAPPGEDPLLAFLFGFAHFLRVLEMEDLPKIVFWRRRPEEELRILNLDPAGIIGERVREFAGSVLMSATLAPAEYFRRTLGIDDPATLDVEFPSPFPRENRRVLLEGRISTRYRDRAAGYGRVAALVEEVASCRTGNYLCFLPSFAYLREVEARLDDSRIERIVQRPAMGEEERRDVLEALRAPLEGRSRVVLGVLGGIFAEGVDYPGDLCIGVIVVSPGLPTLSFENECVRAYHDEIDGRGFEFAYLFPGIHRVIQSAGRLIRTPEDRGVIVLVGQRFKTDVYARCLPREWVEGEGWGESSEGVVEGIRAFWEGQGEDEAPAAGEGSPENNCHAKKFIDNVDDLG